MDTVTYALIAERLAKWNPIGVPNELAEDEYLSYVPGVYGAATSGSLPEYLCAIARDFGSGLSVAELYDHPEIVDLIHDIELIVFEA